MMKLLIIIVTYHTPQNKETDTNYHNHCSPMNLNWDKPTTTTYMGQSSYYPSFGMC